MAKKKVETVEEVAEVKVSESDLAIVKAINIMSENMTKSLEEVKKLLIEIRNGGVQW